MRIRICATLALIIAVMTSMTSPAQAAIGPAKLQRLAAVQTQLLFRDYHGSPQVASPATCNAGQDGHAGDGRGEDRSAHGGGAGGVFLLPTLSFGSGAQSFWCHIEAKAVLVDLGGAVATEDKRGDLQTLADGEMLTFARGNLSRICDDALRFFSPSAPATVDGRPLVGTPVSTGTFEVKVNSDAAAPGLPFYQDSVDLGHPGSLAACYTGQKAIVPLTAGRHEIRVTLAGADGLPSQFTYHIFVEGR